MILLIQFILLIIDRALYLRRNVRGKLFFQLFQVIAVHIWLFFVLPAITHMCVFPLINNRKDFLFVENFVIMLQLNFGICLNAFILVIHQYKFDWVIRNVLQEIF